MIEKNWEPYNADRHVMYNYINGFMKCTNCGAVESPATNEGLNDASNSVARLNFQQAHKQCVNTLCELADA